MTDNHQGPADARAHRSLPAALRLGRVRLQVADLERSQDWYRQVLGPTVKLTDASHAELFAADDPLPLIELHERPRATAVPHGGRLGLYHYALLLPDRAALGRLVAHLGAAAIPAGASDHLVSEALYLHDPDGLGIEVYADRPRERWQYRDGQLLMATDPLDLADLVRDAAGEPWTGLPAGTVLGHIHLHVGNLALAEDFYHQAIGFDVMVRGYPGALFLSAGGYHHHLGLNTWARGARSAGEADARLLSWEIDLRSRGDAEAALARAAAAGFQVERTATGGRVPDPWGTTLEVLGGGLR